jgi:hypothetical protein
LGKKKSLLDLVVLLFYQYFDIHLNNFLSTKIQYLEGNISGKVLLHYFHAYSNT